MIEAKNNNDKTISVFDRRISWFTNMFDTEPKVTTLGEFLFGMSERHKEQILRLRSTTDKQERTRIKKSLPQATISGEFRGRRKAENLVAHSGLICIDIDEQDNTEVTDFRHLKENVLSCMEEVVYAAKSVGGMGYFAIFMLRYPDLHARQFRQLQADFARLGITIDNACSDVSRLRCLSYDEAPYINEHAVPYGGLQEVKSQVLCHEFHRWRSHFADDTDERVYLACREIERYHIDMTADYGTWIQIGFSLASLGEEGREYFHVVSRQNPKYNQRETDQKFTSFMRGNNRVSIGTFFHFCKQFGVSGIG